MSKTSGPRRSHSSREAEGHQQVAISPEVVERLRTRLTAIKGWTQMTERYAMAGGSSADFMPYLRRSLEAITEMQETLDRVSPGGPLPPPRRFPGSVRPSASNSYRN
ncbi:MAG TPA: hypothetical protein VK009_19680 [Chloroflexota bacterium]|nr:hypothetical protein [Chloroflexota bacterium]